MKIVKITGGIGAGKSLAGQVLQDLGAVVIDADIVAKKFRQSSYLDSAAIFGDAALLRQIENKTHPLVVAEIERQINDLASGERAVFILVPALKYFGADIKCDMTIALTADEKRRVERVMLRSGLSAEEVRLRITNQASDSEIAAAADIVIENNGTKEQLIESVKKTYNSIV